MDKQYLAYAVNEAVASLLTLLGRLEQETEVRWVCGGEKPTEFIPKGICRYLLYNTRTKDLIWSSAASTPSDICYIFEDFSNFIRAINDDMGVVAQKPEVVKEDNHEGMIYNPYTDDWSWF